MPSLKPDHLLQRVLFLTLLLLLLLAHPFGAVAASEQEAVFAGGCFWCLEHDLETLPGVLTAESGYSGGRTVNPTYKQVGQGGTGHAESVLVRFDPEQISYDTLLRAFWRNVDPTDGAGQFCDRGDSYRPVIFTVSAEQRASADQSLLAAQRELGSGRTIAVTIESLKRFWPAEDYHQDYADRNPLPYRYYRWRCGRDARLDQLWGQQARSSKVWFSPPATPANAG